MAFPKAITPDLIKNLKDSNKYFEALEEMAEKLPKLLEIMKTDKPFVICTEIHENGDMKMYLDNKLLSQTKLEKDGAKKVLLVFRNAFLH